MFTKLKHFVLIILFFSALSAQAAGGNSWYNKYGFCGLDAFIGYLAKSVGQWWNGQQPTMRAPVVALDQNDLRARRILRLEPTEKEKAENLKKQADQKRKEEELDRARRAAVTVQASIRSSSISLATLVPAEVDPLGLTNRERILLGAIYEANNETSKAFREKYETKEEFLKAIVTQMDAESLKEIIQISLEKAHLHKENQFKILAKLIKECSAVKRKSNPEIETTSEIVFPKTAESVSDEELIELLKTFVLKIQEIVLDQEKRAKERKSFSECSLEEEEVEKSEYFNRVEDAISTLKINCPNRIFRFILEYYVESCLASYTESQIDDDGLNNLCGRLLILLKFQQEKIDEHANEDVILASLKKIVLSEDLENKEVIEGFIVILEDFKKTLIDQDELEKGIEASLSENLANQVTMDDGVSAAPGGEDKDND
jgi:hypothetical protein